MKGIAAIIPLSRPLSKSEPFGPLTLLNGFPLIQMVVQSALDGGAQEICVVSDAKDTQANSAIDKPNQKTSECNYFAEMEQAARNAVEPIACELSTVSGLTAALDAPLAELSFSKNVDHVAHYVLGSVKCGLKDLLTKNEAHTSKIMSAFVLPGSMPGVRPQTFCALLQAAFFQKTDIAAGCKVSTKASTPAVLVPTFEGKRGFPLLLHNSTFEALLSYEGEGPLQTSSEKGEGGPCTALANELERALAGFNWQEVPVDDPGIVLSVESFDALESYVARTRGVSEHIAADLFKYYKTPSNVHEHTRAVAEIAFRMARKLNTLGYGLDAMLCYSGGELHDLNRLEPNHSMVAEKNLRDLGYVALAEVVRAHDRELTTVPHFFTEANIVFVADKLAKDTTLVSIKHRYEGALKRFPLSTPLGKVIERDSKNAIALLEEYVRLTGDTALLDGSSNFQRREYHDAP